MERTITNPWKWQDQRGFVQANLVSGVQRTLVYSGQTSVDADGTPVRVVGGMAGQINQALDNLDTVLREGGFKLSDIVRLNYYTTDVDGFFEAIEVVGSRLAESGCRAASTLLGVTRLAFPELLVEIEATAVA